MKNCDDGMADLWRLELSVLVWIDAKRSLQGESFRSYIGVFRELSGQGFDQLGRLRLDT